MPRSVPTFVGCTALGLSLLCSTWPSAVYGQVYSEDIAASDIWVGPLDLSESWPASVDPIMALRILAPELLPPSLRTPPRLPGIRPPAYTTTLLSLSRHRQVLSPFLKHRLDVVMGRTSNTGGDVSTEVSELGRPYSGGSFSSSTYPLTVHYRHRFASQRAKDVLGFAEHAYAVILEAGFYAPLPDQGLGGSDNLDIYLVGETRSGGGAFTSVTEEDLDPSDGSMGCATYIMVYENLDMTTEMPVFVAHELVHSFQAAMDFTEWPFFWESTAVAMEDIIYDGINDYYSFIDDFQRRPHYALNETSGLYPYGAGIFAQFLDEVLGQGDGQLLATLWQRTGQVGLTNEPDYLDVIDDIASETGSPGNASSLAELFAEFTGWRYFAADMSHGSYFDESPLWPSAAKVPIVATLDLSDLPIDDLAPPAEDYVDPQDFGANYFKILTNSNPDGAVEITLEGLQEDGNGPRWGLVVIRFYEDTDGDFETHTSVDADGPINMTVSILGADHLAIAPINLSTTDYDADGPSQSSPYRLSLSMH